MVGGTWIEHVTDGAQHGGVEDSAVVEVQQENWRVGRDDVQLSNCRQPFFSELMFAPPTTRRRRDGDLALEHAHGVGQATHAVPAQGGKAPPTKALAATSS